MSILALILIIILSIIPSLIWLVYYLHKDPHPEPRRIIIKLFLTGFIMVPFIAMIELYGQHFFQDTAYTLKITLYILIGIATLEEIAKFLGARSVFRQNKKDFDEAPDAMIYLITVALGFAAAENIIILSSFFNNTLSADNVIRAIALRSVGAVLLHALASGIVGYFIALKYFYKKKHKMIEGIIIAILFHTAFNYLILSAQNKGYLFLILIIVLLGIGLIFIHKDFNKLKAKN